LLGYNLNLVTFIIYYQKHYKVGMIAYISHPSGVKVLLQRGNSSPRLKPGAFLTTC